MAKSIAVVNVAANDTFQIFINRVNEVINAVSTEVVTANVNANGSLTTGNAYVNGIFGAATLTVFTALRGGNVQSSDNLVVTSNLAVTGGLLNVGSFSVNSTVVRFTSNINVNTTSISIGNSTVNSVANSSTYNLGNTSIGRSSVGTGNSTVNSIVNSTSVIISFPTSSQYSNSLLTRYSDTANSIYLDVGTAGIQFGADPGGLTGTSVLYGNVTTSQLFAGINVIVGNASLTTYELIIGNTTTNAVANVINFKVGNSTVNAVLNTVALVLSGNLQINSTVFKVGNSTVNTVVNSSMITLSGANVITAATAARVAQNSTSTYSRSRLNFVNGTNITVDVSDDSGNGQINVQIHASTTNALATAAGSNTQVQVNGNGAFTAYAGLTFDYAANTLSVANQISTANVVVSNNVQLSGRLIINNVSYYRTVSYTAPNTSTQEIDNFYIADYRGGEYLLSIKDNNANGYQLTKFLLIHDGTNSYVTEFGTLTTNASLGDFSYTMNTTHVIVSYTPVSTNTTIKGSRTMISV